MGFCNALNIAGSALTAERFRMDMILQNLANQNTTRTANGEPYRRKQVIFEERAVDFASVLEGEKKGVQSGGVRVAQVVESQRDFTPVYDPTHPDANEEGYVMYPNVNSTEERVDLIAASNAYEANLTAFNLVKQLAVKTLELGK
jgi:flagellar basal-body rod protein FlgC